MCFRNRHKPISIYSRPWRASHAHEDWAQYISLPTDFYPRNIRLARLMKLMTAEWRKGRKLANGSRPVTGWTGRTRLLMWTGRWYWPVLSKITQPLTGWTGQTRRLMWTGQKYRPVRVKLTSLHVCHNCHSLFLSTHWRWGYYDTHARGIIGFISPWGLLILIEEP